MQKIIGFLKKFSKKIQYNAPVTLTFALLSLFALILNGVTGGAANRLLFSVYKSSVGDPLTYVRVFTHVLGHANYEHYSGNFLMILVIGPLLEEKYGSRKMLLTMAATAFITGIIAMAFINGALLGASGVVFMLILLSSFVNLEKGRVPVTLLLVVVVFLGNEIASGLFKHDNVSQLTHVAGGLCGALVGFALNKKKLT